MLTNEDIEKLKTALATKDDFNELKNDFVIFKNETHQNFSKMVTLEEFDGFKSEIKQEFSDLREAIQVLAVSVDGLSKVTGDLLYA